MNKHLQFRLSIKTAMLILTSLFIVSAPAFALELVYDAFDYGTTAGDLTTMSGGNWTAHSGSGNVPVQYVASSLSMPGYSAGTGGSATFTNGSAPREDVNRAFAAQSSGTVYYAALVNLSSASSAYFMHLRDTGTGFRARVFARDSGGNLQFGLRTSNSTGTYSTTNFSYNTTYLVVAWYDIGTGNSTLHVLSACSATEPGTPLLTDTGTSGTTISTVAIRQTSGSTAGTIDDVRVADSWADVVSSCSVTAVELASFSAAATDGGSILLEWETATELGNLGFNLYRATSTAADAARTQLNANLIPAAHPGSAVGASYQFADGSVAPGMTYYYWLEDVDLYGVATLHGPVSARLDPLRRLLPVRPRLAPAAPIQFRR